MRPRACAPQVPHTVVYAKLQKKLSKTRSRTNIVDDIHATTTCRAWMKETKERRNGVQLTD